MTPRQMVAVIGATTVAYGKRRIFQSGLLFYLMVWWSVPIFWLCSIALIYKEDTALRDYAIIGGSSVSFIFLMLYGAGSALDVERLRGTLGTLMLAPAPRYAWLGGFQVFSLIEVLLSSAATLAIATAIFGIDFDLHVGSLLLTLVLFLLALWGMSMMVGSLGVALRDANQLTNLLFSFVPILAGTMIPIDRLPEWLQVPARCLPFGYGMEGLYRSLVEGASPADLAGTLWPLAGFAVVLPVLGVIVFEILVRSARGTGTLDFIA
jgi:ABC-2 type transport system permease protein